MPESVEQFAARIKAKYPAYQDVPDRELVERVLAKYPEYRDRVTLEEPPGLLERAGKWALHTIEEQGPVMGGAAVGGTLGAPAGPVGVIVGGALGGATGKALQILSRAAFEREKAPQTPGEALGQINQAIASGALQEVGGALAGKGAQAAAKGLVKSRPFGSEAQYERVLAPTKERAKTLVREKLAPELSRRKIVAPSRAALLEKAETQKKIVASQLEFAYKRATQSGKINTQPIIAALEKAKKQFVVDNVDVLPAATSKVDDLKEIIQAFGDDISPESLRQTRQIWDKIVARAGGYAGRELGEASQVYAQKQVANAIRREIGKQFPNIKRLNAEYSFWSNVSQVLEQTIQRETGRALSMTDLMSGLGGAVGIAAGQPWAATAPLVLRFLQSTAWRTVSASSKQRVADLLAKGKLQQAVELMGRLVGAAVTQIDQQETTTAASK